MIANMSRYTSNHIVAILALALGAGSWVCLAQAEGWKIPASAPLLTQWSKDVGPDKALPDYPRPQMARANWQNLNGLWDYAITDKTEEKIPAAYDGKILVPYPIESALSGVMKPFLPNNRLWYRRTLALPEVWHGQRILLHFGAVDWETTVYLNGRELGGHRGGYDAFTFDITKALKSGAAQELVVSVLDPTDTSWHLHGKQVLHPAGCSYTATSGIWQTVWLEPVPLTTSIESLYAVPDLDRGGLKLTITGRIGNEPLELEAKAFDGKKEVSSSNVSAGFELWPTLRENKVNFYKNTGSWFTTNLFLPIEDAKLWSPNHPFLYDMSVVLKDKNGNAQDTVRSYFGMRSLGKKLDPKGFTRFLLNGQPTLMAGALDQGFWPDGIYTAATDEALKYDVQIARQAGLNIIRKHVKVEPDRFYYWCDKLGLMVLQDMPTGKEGDPKTDLPTSSEASTQCELEKRALIQQRWNHPSIIAWCPFNEGWGQHDTLRYATWIKELDPSRLVDEASGFPWHGGGDIQDNHGGISAPNPNQIGLVSENGGFGLATPGHDWPCEIWTYHSYDAATDESFDALGKGFKGIKMPKLDEKSKAWFTREVARLYSDLWAQKDTRGMTGQFFCQLYDTESECDGLVSYDRAVWKVDAAVIAKAARGELKPGELGTSR
jgi:Glycosyl hydrolases family 2, sugar binding domain/Glycosyl hydrolases family 2, TIM barrel domain/Glycosyl hydrolases family 2